MLIDSSLLNITILTDALVLIVSTFSMLVNIGVIYLAFFRQKGPGIDLLLVRLITVADMGYAIFGVIQTSYKFSISDHLIMYSKPWCAVSQFINGFSIAMSIGLVCILSVLRYTNLVLGKHFKPIFWYGTIIVYTIYHFSLTISSIFISELIPSPSLTWCQPGDMSNSFDLGYLIVSTVEYGLQLSILTFSYIAITVRYTNKMVKAQDTRNTFNSDSDLFKPAHSTLAHQRKAIVIKMVVMLIIYHICITPYVLITFSELVMIKLRSPSLDSLMSVTINCINMANPIFLILLHDPTRKDFWLLLDKLKMKSIRQKGDNICMI